MSLNLNLNLNTGLQAGSQPKLELEKVYDVLVVGGGPAGLNAALYAKRKGLDVGIIAERIGGQVLDTSSVENYLGTNKATGEELAKEFEAHVRELRVPLLTDAKVSEIEDGRLKTVKLSNGKSVQTKAVILSTGSKPRKLGVPGEAEFAGKGVAYCAICDGPLFTDMDVIVAGGGNSAVEAALDLSKTSSKVYLVHRSDFRADKILVDKLAEADNIDVYLQTQILEIKGDKIMSGIRALDKSADHEIEIEANGLFVEIGYLPNSEPFKGLVDMSENGSITITPRNQTSRDGVFAAGDVTTVPYKQIVIAASEGAKAALSANEYIQKL